ncbi:glycosyltransferase, partial [Pseudolactococcus laudensis]|uniref:glycosyltransferase n=1 Tax=Pseudolactococcus laudensis TaxID=1494461 RepID=UPI003F9D80DF
MLNFLSIFLLVYGVLAISHIVFQIILCHSDHRRKNKKSFKDFHSNYKASVSVIVPAYNEVPQILKNCIDSIVAQKIPDLEIIVVDDGSKNREELIEKVYN